MSNTKRYTVRGRTVFTEEQVQERIALAVALAGSRMPTKQEMRAQVFKDLGIPANTADSTPSRVNKLKDPFSSYLDRERADLCLGDLSDDELANAVFMHGNPYDRDREQTLLSGGIPSIAYVTAAKERIRWLSRQLNIALEREQKLLEEYGSEQRKEG